MNHSSPSDACVKQALDAANVLKRGSCGKLREGI